VALGSGVLGTRHIPGIVAAFNVRYPRVDVVLRQQPNEQTMAMLLSGEIDLGVVIMHPSSRPPPGIALEPRGTVAMGALVPGQHRLASNERLAVRDLADERLILASPSSASRVAIDLAFERAALQRRIRPFETMTSAIAALVGRGLGVGITSETTAQSAPADLVFLEMEELDRCNIDLAWADQRPMTPQAAALLQFLRQRDWNQLLG
jgi:DNA-binding transcriptional LysR family regulator